MKQWGQESGSDYVPIVDRGAIKYQTTRYGVTEHGTQLQVFTPSEWPQERLLILAGIHGEEPQTTHLLSHCLRTITPASLKCGVILCANPDGMINGTRGNAHNVDLNRNFPSSDWSPEPSFAKWQENTQQIFALSSGASPASEIETSSLITLISELRIDRIISIHAALACVDYDSDAEWPLVSYLSASLELPIVSDIGYPCPGSMGSWAKEQKIPIITLELPDMPLGELRSKYGPTLLDVLISKV